MKETIKGIEEIKDKIKTDLTLIVNLDKVKKIKYFRYQRKGERKLIV